MEAYSEFWRGLFGYLSLLAIANAFTDRWRAFTLRYFPYFAIVLAQLIVPLNSERLLFYSFPFVIPLAMVELERIREDLPDWFPLLCTLLFFFYLFTPNQVVVPLGLVVLARILVERRRAGGKGA
jgi:hypothetical protein